MSIRTVTLNTLAPATLDRAGTESVGSYWLYTYETVPEQALREVVMPEASSSTAPGVYGQNTIHHVY